MKKLLRKLFAVVLSLLMCAPNGLVGTSVNAESDIGPLLDDVTLFSDYDCKNEAEKNSEGRYTVKPNSEYGIMLHFKEGDNNQLDLEGNDPVSVYQLPVNGINWPEEGFNGTFDIKDAQNTQRVLAGDNRYTIDKNGKLTIHWNKPASESQEWKDFYNARNAEFSIKAKAKFDENASEIDFGNNKKLELTVDTTHNVSVKKTVPWDCWDKGSDTVKYSAEIDSTGTNKDVKVEDTLTGTALTYDPSKFDLEVTDASGKTVDTSKWNLQIASDGKSFTAVIPSMSDGEKYTLTYRAKIDYEVMDPNKKGTVEETENGIKITTDGDHNPDDNSSSADLKDKIDFSDISKNAADVSEENDQKIRTVTWKAAVNMNHKVSLHGKDITDTLEVVANKNKSTVSYSGEGINITVKDENGTIVRNGLVKWGEDGLSNSRGSTNWTYTVPDTDGKYSYEFSYTTDVDLSNVKYKHDAPVIKNTIGHDGKGAEASQTVGPDKESSLAIKKTHQPGFHKDKVEYTVTVTADAEGYSKFVITDDLPSSSGWYDAYKKGTAKVVTGLQDGEKAVPSLSDDGHHLTFTFYKADGKPGLDPSNDGLPRDIVVSYQTDPNDDALAESAKRPTEAWRKDHKNTAKVNADDHIIHTEDIVTFDQVQIEKSADSGYSDGQKTINDNGVELPVYKFTVKMRGVTNQKDLVIHDTYDSRYLKLYTGDTISGKKINDNLKVTYGGYYY